MYRNFNLKSSKGKFYRSSKERTEEHTVEAKDKEGKTYYHQEQDSVGGTLVGVRLSEPPFGGEQMAIILQDGDDRNVIQFTTLKDAATVDSWARAFCYYLDNLNIGDDLVFSLNQKAKDAEGYLYKNVYVKRDGEKVEWAFEWKDVPKGKEVPSKLDKKKKVMDYSDANAFYYDIITRNVERLGIHKEEAPKEESAAVTDNVSENELSDLPF